MKIKAIVLLFIIVFLSGCANTNSVSENTNGIQFTDSLNRTVTISEPKRVGIASGSLAECWILAGGEVCAVTKDAVTEKELDCSSWTLKSENPNQPPELFPERVLVGNQG